MNLLSTLSVCYWIFSPPQSDVDARIRQFMVVIGEQYQGPYQLVEDRLPSGKTVVTASSNRQQLRISTPGMKVCGYSNLTEEYRKLPGGSPKSDQSILALASAVKANLDLTFPLSVPLVSRQSSRFGNGKVIVKWYEKVNGLDTHGQANQVSLSFHEISGRLVRVNIIDHFRYGSTILTITEDQAKERASNLMATYAPNEARTVRAIKKRFIGPFQGFGSYDRENRLRNKIIEYGYEVTFDKYIVFIDGDSGRCLGAINPRSSP